MAGLRPRCPAPAFRSAELCLGRTCRKRERERDGQELGEGKRSAASLGLVEAETPQHKKEREREMGKSSAEATDAASLGLVEAEAAQKECCICLKTEQLGKLLALVLIWC